MNFFLYGLIHKENCFGNSVTHFNRTGITFYRYHFLSVKSLCMGVPLSRSKTQSQMQMYSMINVKYSESILCLYLFLKWTCYIFLLQSTFFNVLKHFD
jgi:hypothetical protein